MHAASLVSFLAIAGTALGGTFTEKNQFDGPNPAGVGLSLYLPNQIKENAPLVVAAHPCGGSASQAYNSYGLQSVADQYGFPVIYPDTPHSNRCWDVTGNPTRKHDAGGDSQGIASMTKYIAKKYKSDTSRIFITGFSSGGMMTELMSAVYPDIFAAGVAFSGMPFGCCRDPNDQPAQMCSPCADGKVTHTGAEWAQIVKDAYPGYSGYRPKMAICHGTADTVINYHSFGEAIKEWTAVFGISDTPVSTQQNTPNSGWTKTVYGTGQVEGYSAAGVGHGMFDVPLVTKFFDLTCPPGGSSCFRRTDSPAPTTDGPTPTPSNTPSTSPNTPTPTVTVPITNPPTSNTPGGSPRWGQCGGNGWTGPTTCSEGSCIKFNDWYSQCQ